MIFSKRPKVVALLLALPLLNSGCSLFGGSPDPEPVRRAYYQPFGASYRGVSYTQTRQNFDDNTTETDFGLRYFIRADVDSAESGLSVTLQLDSIAVDEGARGGVTQQQVDSAGGAVFQANLEPNGRLSNFYGGESSGGLASELADRILKRFFPIIPGHGAEVGAAWVDTLDSRMVVNGMENTVSLISEHTALDWTTHAGERALQIATMANYTFTGSGSQAGNDFTLEGSGRRHITRFISEQGRYLGLVSADTSDGEAQVPALGIVIPIQQTRNDSLKIIQ